MSNVTNGNRPIVHNEVIVNVPEWIAFPSITKYLPMLIYGSVDGKRPYIVQLRDPLNRPTIQDARLFNSRVVHNGRRAKILKRASASPACPICKRYFGKI